MKAIVARRFGTPPDMAVEERAVPGRGPGQALVRVRAATISPYNNAIRTGAFGPGYATAPLVPGVEGAGVVEEGERFPPGTRVAVYGGGELGTRTDGLFREWAAVAEHHLVPVPDALDWAEASALSVNYLTAHLALTDTAPIGPGQTVLVAGGTGSVGHACVQTARALGARPIAVVSSPAKARRAELAGAWAVIDRSARDLGAAVAELTGGRGADLAVDPVGGPLLGELLRALRPQGTVVSIGFAASPTAELAVMDLVGGETRIAGLNIFARSTEDVAPALARLGRLAGAGTLRPVIDSRFPLADFEDGYARLASRRAVGSVVIEL